MGVLRPASSCLEPLTPSLLSRAWPEAAWREDTVAGGRRSELTPGNCREPGWGQSREEAHFQLTKGPNPEFLRTPPPAASLVSFRATSEQGQESSGLRQERAGRSAKNGLETVLPRGLSPAGFLVEGPSWQGLHNTRSRSVLRTAAPAFTWDLSEWRPCHREVGMFQEPGPTSSKWRPLPMNVEEDKEAASHS